MLEDITMKELLTSGSKDINGPSTGVFCVLTYTQGVALLSKACKLVSENTNADTKILFNKIIIRCEDEINEKLPLAELDHKYFNEFIETIEEQRYLKRERIDVLPKKIISSVNEMSDIIKSIKNKFEEPFICELECAFTLIKSSADMAKRIIKTNKKSFGKINSQCLEYEI